MSVLLLLLCFIEISGSTAVTQVFVQTGDDLILNITEEDIPKDFRLWLWLFNSSSLVEFSPNSQPVVVGDAKRIEVLEKKYSLKVKNLQKSDSGIYTAKVSSPKEKKLTEYNVTVQDPVPPVYLTIDSVSSTSSSCNLTVTCSTKDANIRSAVRCDHKICLQEEEKSSEVPTSASLNIHLSHSSIICNHSNQVSWSEDIKRIEQLCLKCTNLSIVYLVKKAVFSVGLIIIASAVFGVHLMEKVKKQK